MTGYLSSFIDMHLVAYSHVLISASLHNHVFPLLRCNVYGHVGFSCRLVLGRCGCPEMNENEQNNDACEC